MASPRHRLGAHHDHPLFTAQLHDSFERTLEGCRLHVIRIAPETRVAPAGVGGIFAGVPQAAQGRHMCVFNTLCRKAGGQGRAIELGILARTGKGADVHEMTDAIRLQQHNKVLDG